jgi:hypothetical protein
MRTVLAIAAFAPLLFAAASCGDDDGGGGTDDEAACLAECEAAHAEELAECDYCGVFVVFEGGSCECYFNECMSELCAAWCEDQDLDGGTCSLDSCTCP